MPIVSAAVWNGPGEPLVVERLRLIDPGEGEVLVRLAASGVCHSDLHVVAGDWIDPYVMSDREKTLTGSNYGSARPALDFPRLLDWYADGQLDLDPLVARRIELAEINTAFDELRSGRATRTVIIHPH